MMSNPSTRNPLVVGLDVERAEAALARVDELRGVAGMFKIGKQLLTSAGPPVVRRVTEKGERVFLDLKYHDIPNTVARAGVEAARLGVSIFNVHASGGGEMMRATAEAVSEAAAREGFAAPLILGVTVLTSQSAESLAEIGIRETVEAQVVRLARLCDESGLGGVVASPHEIAPVRRAVTRKGFVILTPGVRPAGASRDDQRRVQTPGEAILAGADYIVVGRPITAASDPRASARLILEEIERARAGNVIVDATPPATR
jgi:orotidine-5'-phosphate decarboxylase